MQLGCEPWLLGIRRIFLEHKVDPVKAGNPVHGLAMMAFIDQLLGRFNVIRPQMWLDSKAIRHRRPVDRYGVVEGADDLSVQRLDICNAQLRRAHEAERRLVQVGPILLRQQLAQQRHCAPGGRLLQLGDSQQPTEGAEQRPRRVQPLRRCRRAAHRGQAFRGSFVRVIRGLSRAPYQWQVDPVAVERGVPAQQHHV